MNININQLKYFYDTVTLGSVNKAALANHVSQPAISQGIKKLEEQIGIGLLSHGKNSMLPTSESQFLLGHISNVFSSIQALEAQMDLLKEEVAGVIRIGISSSIAKAYLIPKLQKFEIEYPNVVFKIKLGKTQTQIDMLENNEIDIGVTVDNGMLANYTTSVLFDGNFELIGREHTQEKFLATESRPEVKELNKALQKTGYALSSMEIESWDLLYELALNKLGYAFVPDFVIQSRDKLKSMNTQFKIPKLKYEVISFSKTNTPVSKASALFVDYLKED